MIKRICLWSGPRNISTALMYSFAQRKDTTVVDEPLYAHYLTSTDAAGYHPGADEVIASQENNGQKVVETVLFGEYPTPVVFFKHMTHHLVELNLDFLKNTINIILTRSPKDMLLSFINQIEEPKLADTGYRQQVELKTYLSARDIPVLVVDSKDILQDPEAKLTELCEFAGISFDPSMLQWPAGPRKEDGVWAKYWYHNVHKSTGFQPYKPKTEACPPRLHELLRQCEKYYSQLVSN